MNKARTQHINSIVTEFSKKATDKYKKGQKEHGGNLWEKKLMPELLAETYDFVIYAATVADQVDELVKAVNQVIEDAIAVGQACDPRIRRLIGAIAPFNYEMVKGND